jgi:hypothetical protein
VKPFTDKQTQLVAIFANQALIEPLSGERQRTGVADRLTMALTL